MWSKNTIILRQPLKDGLLIQDFYGNVKMTALYHLSIYLDKNGFISMRGLIDNSNYAPDDIKRFHHPVKRLLQH